MMKRKVKKQMNENSIDLYYQLRKKNIDAVGAKICCLLYQKWIKEQKFQKEKGIGNDL